MRIHEFAYALYTYYTYYINIYVYIYIYIYYTYITIYTYIHIYIYTHMHDQAVSDEHLKKASSSFCAYACMFVPYGVIWGGQSAPPSEEKIGCPAVREYFESLGLDIWDAWTFFKLLDLDAGGAVEAEARTRSEFPGWGAGVGWVGGGEVESPEKFGQFWMP